MKTFQVPCSACGGVGSSKYKTATTNTTAPLSKEFWDNIPYDPCYNCKGSGIETHYIWELQDFEDVKKMLEKN